MTPIVFFLLQREAIARRLREERYQYLRRQLVVEAETRARWEEFVEQVRELRYLRQA